MKYHMDGKFDGKDFTIEGEGTGKPYEQVSSVEKFFNVLYLFKE